MGFDQVVFRRPGTSGRLDAQGDAEEFPEDIVETTSSMSLGWAPALSVVIGAGLVLLAFAYGAGRGSSAWAPLLFWSALALIYTPSALRLLKRSASRSERIGILLVLGLGLYLVKVLNSPIYFTFYDEFAHWRAVTNIVATHHLFQANPLLPVTSFFFGLHNITVSLIQVAGLDAYTAGIVVIGTARIVVILALFLLFEAVSRSSYIAGLGVLIYMCSPIFVFFDAQFGYESLALPLTIFALTLMALRADAKDEEDLFFNILFLITLATLVVTHHLTGYLFALFLGVLLLIQRFTRRHGVKEVASPITLFIVLTVSWLIYIATVIVGYISPHILNTVGDVMRLVNGDLAPRSLFSNNVGSHSPLWDRIVGIGAVLLILLALPAGLIALWRKYRDRSLALTFGLIALAFPVSLGLRFIPRATEISMRLSGTLFLGIGLIGALAVASMHRGRFGGRMGALLIATGLSITFFGGIIAGFSPLSRIPGPYLVAADSRSVELRGIAAARWAAEVLGPGRRIVADRTNRQLIGAYGQQSTVSRLADGVYIVGIYYEPSLSPKARNLLRQGNVEYVVIDWRLSTSMPVVNGYVEGREPIWERRPLRPLEREALAKFEAVEGVSRLYDNGDIVIYDVKALSRP